MKAHARLVIIVRAANRLANNGKEWKPNFSDTNQRKYEAWFVRGSSGFRFFGYAYWNALSLVGSRLCFISSEVAEYVATTFIKEYNDYLA